MMLITIRPGPVLHVWRDGQEVAQVALTTPAALSLLADLGLERKARDVTSLQDYIAGKARAIG